MILALFFIVSIYYLGYLLGSFFIPQSKIPRLTIYFLFGSIFSCSFIFITNFLVHNLIASIAIYFFFFLITAIFTFKKNHRKVLSYLINRQNIVGVFVVFLVFVFFQRTFNYDKVGNFFNIQSNLFQDFGAHISFIRYFSNEGSYLPAVPLSSGENLFYHFMFDFYASILKRMGLRVDYAFNLISALSFVHLFVIMVGLSNLVFKSKIVGYIAGAFLFLGTDLSFLQLVDKYGFSITSWYHHNSYIVGELLGVEMVKSFLSINTYINQRHLIFALLFFSSIVFLTYENRLNKIQAKVKICMVLLLGFFSFWHITALISSYFFLLMTALINRKIRKDIIQIVVGSAIITLPQLLVIKLSSVNEILFNPGFLLAPKLSFLILSFLGVEFRIVNTISFNWTIYQTGVR